MYEHSDFLKGVLRFGVTVVEIRIIFSLLETITA
jgi:hypothetical protein